MKQKIRKILFAFALLLITSNLFSQHASNSNEASNFVLYPSGGTISKARIAQIIARTSSHANRSISSTNHAPIANNDTVSLCKNSTITIHVQNNDSDPDGDPLTTSIYATIGTGVFALNGNSINYTPPHNGYTGNDTVIYVICDGRTPSLCDTAIAFIHVVPSYTTNLSVSICNGDSAFIAGAYHTIGGVFTNTLTATGGCDSIIVTSLTVNARPIPVITPDGPTSFCHGDSVHLSVNANTSYLWSTGATTQSISVLTSGNYYVTVKNPSGCSATSATVMVTVIPSLTITPSSTSICAGGSTTLTASGALNYTWSPAATLSNDTGSVVIATPPSTTNYTLVGASGLCVASATINVTVNPLPIISITPSATTICAGNSTTLTASGALTYTWAPSTDLSVATGSVVVATPTATATYTVSGSGAICTGVKTVLVTVTPLPVIVITPSSPTICAGNSTVLTASGASTYTWSPITGLSSVSGSTVTANPSSTQTYTITGKSGLCSATQTAQVTVAPNPTITITPSSTLICITTSATLTAGGADTYTWSPITSLDTDTGSVVTATPTTTTTYSVTGTLGICPSSKTVLITVITPPTPTITASGPSTFCQGDSVKLTSSAGTTYLWSTGATTQTITANASGDYSVTVFNTCGSGSTSFSVTVNPLPIATITPNGPTTFCQGDSVKLTSSVGSSYVWSTTATTQVITVHSSGTYSVKVTDANGCSATSATLSVLVNPLPIISVTPPAPTICAGNSTTLTASGALTYTWAPSTDLSITTGSVVIATPTSTATYTVSGSDANCTGVKTVVVTVTPLPVIVITPASPTICAGNSTVLTASGATTYTWSPATGLNTTTGNVVVASPTATATYTVAGSGATCIGTETVEVTVIPLPVIAITPSSTSICAGGSTTLTASGALNYTWSPAATLSNDTGSVVIATPPSTTNYTLVGASGLCVASATINVTVNPLPIISITPSATTICAGNSTTLTASGALTYTWAPSTDLSVATGSVVVATPTATATYTVSGSGATCTGVKTVVVTVTPLPVIVITPSSPTICAGNSTVLTASGASTYTWSPITGLSSVSGSTVTANPSSTQTYTITGKSGLCSATQTAQVTVAPNPTITITPSSTLICITTSATLTAGGADTYTWSPITSLDTDTGSVVTATPTTTTTYSVTGTLGICPSSKTVLITVITPPTPTITASGPSTFCQGDSVKLTSSAGTTYLWSTGATTQTITANASGDYSVTVFNTCGSGSTSFSVTVNPLPIATITPNGPTTFCQGDSVKLTSSVGSSYVWSTTATTQAITVHSSGTYSVKVTDANGCSATSATLSVLVNPLPIISVTPPAPTICAGNSTTLTASGALTYTWAPSADLSTTTGSVVIATPTSTATYTVSGSDANCTGVKTVVVTVTPLPVIVITPASPTICAGNSTVLTASGATTYTWSPATGLSSASGSTVTANPASNGTYTVIGTNLGCTSSQTVQITVAPNPTITITPSSTLICVSTSATLSAGGATTYTWSPITSLNTGIGSLVTATPTISTTYSVTGTLGICPSTQTVLIIVITPPTPTITANGPTTFCLGDSVKLTSSVGTTYLWSTGAMTQTISVNTSGSYSVTTTNVNGCFATSAITTVSVNPLPTASITPSGLTTFCQGDSVILNANNGLSWLWSTGEITQSIKVITSGIYTVAVTNICGSIASSPVTVTVNPLPSTTVTQIGSTTFCQGDSVQLTASIGSHYLWSNGDTTRTITVDSSGNYSAIVTNSFGCHATSSSTSVTVNPLAVAAFTPGEVKASMTYSFTNTSTNTISYAWYFGDGQTSTAVNPTNVYAVGGVYNVTLIATNGCGPDTLTETLSVVSNSEFYNGFSPNGDGHNDFWNIPTLNDNTTNTVKVINRWGSEVWQGINYDNVSVVWKGQNMSGEDLPDGTYYFIITYGKVDKRGWVIIKR